MTFEELLEVARSRDEIVGLYVFGSRGRKFMVDERSDWDVCLVLAGREARDAFAREFPYVHGARVEIVSVTLDELRTASSEHGRYAAAHAAVVLDKTGGELTRVVAELDSLPAGSNPLEDWTADELLPLLDRVLTGEPEPQRKVFNRIEPRARREGYGDVVDGWEPDVDWLRGKGEYRA